MSDEESSCLEESSFSAGSSERISISNVKSSYSKFSKPQKSRISKTSRKPRDTQSHFDDSGSIFVKHSANENQDDQYFISNVFVEKVFDSLSLKLEFLESRLESKIALLVTKIDTLLDIRDV